MKDKGIKMLERLKMLAGIYKRAGEKRNAAVKALSVVLVFAVVMANLTVPKMKVKAADVTPRFTIYYGDYTRYSEVAATEPIIINGNLISEDENTYTFGIDFDSIKDHVFASKDGKLYLINKFDVIIPSNQISTDLGELIVSDSMSIENVNKENFSAGSEVLDMTLIFDENDVMLLKDIKMMNRGDNSPLDENQMYLPKPNEFVIGQYHTRYVKYNWTVPSTASFSKISADRLVSELVGWKLDITQNGAVHSGPADMEQHGDTLFINGQSYPIYIPIFKDGDRFFNDIYNNENLVFNPVGKVDLAATFDVGDGGTITSGSTNLANQTAVYDGGYWKLEIPVPTVVDKPGFDFKGWKVATNVQEYEDESTEFYFHIAMQSSNPEYVYLDEASRVSIQFDDRFASAAYTSFSAISFIADYESTGNTNETLTLNVNYKFLNSNNNAYYYSGTDYTSKVITMARPESPEIIQGSNTAGYYRFTIPAADLKKIPIFYTSDPSSSSSYNSLIANSFSVPSSQTGYLFDQVIDLGTGVEDQTILIATNKFANASLEATIEPRADDDLATSLYKRDGVNGGSTDSFHVSEIVTENGVDYGKYYTTTPNSNQFDSNLPTDYTSGLVDTVLKFANDEVIVRETDSGNVVTEMSQGQAYTVLVPVGDIGNGLVITSSPILKLPINFNAGSDGSTDPNANKTYTTTQLDESTGEWTLSLTVPGVEVSDSSKEFKGWKVPTGMPEAIRVNSVNGGYLDQNTVLTISNEYAQSVASNYSLTFTADIDDIPTSSYTIPYSWDMERYANNASGTTGQGEVTAIREGDLLVFTIDLPAPEEKSGCVFTYYVVANSVYTLKKQGETESASTVDAGATTYTMDVNAYNSNTYIYFSARYDFTPINVKTTYNAGANGKIGGTNNSSVVKTYSFIDGSEGSYFYCDVFNDIPTVTGNDGYIFVGWERDENSPIEFRMKEFESGEFEYLTVPTKDDRFVLAVNSDIIIGQSDPQITIKAAYKHSAMTLSRNLGTGAGTGSTAPGNVTLYPVDYIEGTDSATGKFKYTLDLPAVTPADGYTFTGYKLTPGDYVITNENGEAIDGNTLLTGTTAIVYITESSTPSTDQISLTATAQFPPVPQLKISFENGGNPRSFNAMSANADSNGNYTYEVTLPGASGGMTLTWTPGTIRTTGAANTVTYQVYRQATDTTALADNAEIYSGEKVYIKANLTEDTPAATWAPGGDPMVGGNGIFTVTFNNGVAFIAPGNWTWTIIEEDNEFEYTVNSQTRVRIYTSPNTTSLQFNMRSN